MKKVFKISTLLRVSLGASLLCMSPLHAEPTLAELSERIAADIQSIKERTKQESPQERAEAWKILSSVAGVVRKESMPYAKNQELGKVAIGDKLLIIRDLNVPSGWKEVKISGRELSKKDFDDSFCVMYLDNRSGVQLKAGTVLNIREVKGSRPLDQSSSNYFKIGEQGVDSIRCYGYFGIIDVNNSQVPGHLSGTLESFNAAMGFYAVLEFHE